MPSLLDKRAKTPIANELVRKLAEMAIRVGADFVPSAAKCVAYERASNPHTPSTGEDEI